MNYTCDHNLFLALNFDGGPVMDTLMTAVSGTLIWIPLYIFIVFWVWRSKGWKTALAFVICLAVALGLADMLCGIFKHSGLLKHVWESFPARHRPMFTEELRGAVHVVSYRHGPYGTVSAHAATVAALAMMSCLEIRRTWFTALMLFITLLICYSRIYLACHFPLDLALGTGVGIVAGGVMFLLYKKLRATIEKYAEK